jgi:DNA-binding MarR family transcriptional regulator
LDFAQQPGLLIIKLAHMMSVDMDRRLKVHEVTISQWAILKQLWQQEGRSQVELQELLGLDGATITGLIQRMIHLDLIQRRSDLNDRRVQRVFLTERGRNLEHITKALEDAVNSRALKGFSSDERTFFIRLLTRALQNCEEDE